jgi:uncharacterized membrane protein YeaQ/YmgE (transglycosylase-associated protein family)
MKKSINYQAISKKRDQNLALANITTGLAGAIVSTLSFYEATTNQEADAGALGFVCAFGLVIVLFSLAIKLNK